MQNTTIAKQGLTLARVSKTFGIAEFAAHVTLLVLSCFCMSVVPFLRTRFGERYLGWVNLYFGYSVVWAFTFLGGFVSFSEGRGDHFFPFFPFPVNIPMVVCYVAFIGVSLYHRFEIWRANYCGEERHSFYMGDPWLKYMFTDDKTLAPCSDEVANRWLEPILVTIIGAIMLKVCTPVGAWLTISGIALFVHSNITYHFQRRSILDTRDAQIEARYMRDALEGKPASETGGFTIAESNLRMINKDAGLKAAFENLGDEMNALFEKKAA